MRDALTFVTGFIKNNCNETRKRRVMGATINQGLTCIDVINTILDQRFSLILPIWI